MEPFPRLKRFAEYQSEIGEILFGISMPSQVRTSTAAPTVTPTMPLTSHGIMPNTMPNAVASGSSTIAHSTPILTDGPVVLSTPPMGVQTIQDEIELADSSLSSNQSDGVNSTAPSTASFVVPSDGIMVHATRYDGRDLPALTGKLIRILPELTLQSNIPEHRSPKQPINMLKSLTKEDATIEEYWKLRFFHYTDEQKDRNSNKRVRICEVLLNDELPFIFPADKLWRLDPLNESIQPNTSIGDVGPLPSSSTLPSSSPQPSLPPPSAPILSTLAQLWLQVAEEPFNLEVWQQIIAESQLTHDLLIIRHALSSFLKVFPTSPTHWRTLIELELQHQQYDEIERILPTALRTIPEIGLWKLYLVYQKIKSTPLDPHPSEEQTRATNVSIETAYEFVLDHMGMDLHSGQVWKSYINFVRGIVVSSPAEEVGKTSSVRKLFQRVISTPIQPKELMHFWEEYQAFERHTAQQFQNKTLMNKMIADYQNKFATTHRESIERRKKYAGILSASVGSSYGSAVTASAVHIASRPSTSKLQQAKDAIQIQNWIKFIRFESRKLEGQDMNVYKNRVVLAYRQCLLYCRHYPNLWADYLSFLMAPKMYFSSDQIRSAWQEFQSAMPYSILPTLIHADIEEELKHTNEAKALYETLLLNKNPSDPLADEFTFKLPHSVLIEQKHLKAYEASRQEAAPAKDQVKEEDVITVKDEPNSDVKPIDTGIIDIYKGELFRTHPIVHILLMQFIRRTEGVDAARKVFLLARRSPFITFHTWLFAAYTEHHINGDLQKAQAIYAAGHRIYGDAMEAYLLQYLNFLKETNDHNNLRLIFGRILLTESAESAESAQHLSRRENAQMRKAHAATAAAAKDSAAAAAAAIVAKETSFTNEAANDPNMLADDWWPAVHGLLPEYSSSTSDSIGSSTSSARQRHDDRDDRRDQRSYLPTPIPSSTLLSLWHSYVSFERDTANELSVIVKAEEKRDLKLAVRYGHKIAHWIDRWRFMDLWSCSPQLRQTLLFALQYSHAQLASIVASEIASDSSRTAALTGIRSESPIDAIPFPRQRGVLFTDPSLVANLKSSVCRPDFTRLSTFTASSHQFDRAGTRGRYGLSTPLPEQILNVLSVLPPSHLFTGPFIHPHLIVDMLQRIPESSLVQPNPTPTSFTQSTSDDKTKRFGQSSTTGGGQRKRKNREVDEEDEADMNVDINTPANDLYRKRQMQKLAKMNE